MRPYFEEGRCRLFLGDSREVLHGLPDGSVDSIVTDPPAGIGFMGKGWDSDKGGRDAWIAWLAEIMQEGRRVLKPGGHALVWALPRTSHWTATALEDSGFEIRDVIAHLFGTGFPKSLTVGDGLGTALKPAAEHWILGRKPLAGTVAKNVDEFGTGALNIDGCRIEALDSTTRKGFAEMGFGGGNKAGPYLTGSDLGRWPANVALSHLPECVIEECAGDGCGHPCDKCGSEYGGACAVPDCTGKRRCECVKCAPGCAVAELDRQSGNLKSGAWSGHRNDPKTKNAFGSFALKDEAPRQADAGGASRFFAVFSSEVECFGPVNGAVSSSTGEPLPAAGSAENPARAKPAQDPATPSVFMNATPSASRLTSGSNTQTTPNSGARFSPESPRTNTSLNSPARSAESLAQIGIMPTTQSPCGFATCAEAATFASMSPSGDHGDRVCISGERFRYVAKPSRSERDAGCAHLPPRTAGEATDREEGTDGLKSPRAGAGRTGGARNFHPTVKAIALMRWLCRLVTPAGGVVLDPFTGSGSTGVAALAEGFSFVGVERDPDYIQIAAARLAEAMAQGELFGSGAA